MASRYHPGGAGRIPPYFGGRPTRSPVGGAFGVTRVPLPSTPLGKAARRTISGLHRRKQRRRAGLFLVEGIRVSGEAIAASADTAFAVCSPRLLQMEGGPERLESIRVAGIDLFAVEDAEMNDLADTTTPQGILLVCRQPGARLEDVDSLSPPAGVLIADAIQDPGNLGTMVRSAAAFGLDAVVALDGTVDPFNAKVVRGTAGACFRIPIVQADWGAVHEWTEATNRRLLVADTSGNDPATIELTEAWALVVGNEAAGVRPDIRELPAARVGISIGPSVESLNAGVAASILLYAMTREAANPL